MNNQSDPQQNNKKLYFGNLPFSMDQDALAALVDEYGEVVEVALITDKFSGRSKGFGFVEFSTDEEAQAAMEALNETEVDGRQIFVKVARPKAPRDDRRSGGRGYGDDNRGGNRGYGRRDN